MGGNMIELKNIYHEYKGGELAPRNQGRKNTKEFEEGVTIFKDLNLEISRGEFLVIVGERASGKTALLNIIAGFEKPTRGTIKVEGKTWFAIRPDYPEHYSRIDRLKASIEEPDIYLVDEIDNGIGQRDYARELLVTLNTLHKKNKTIIMATAQVHQLGFSEVGTRIIEIKDFNYTEHGRGCLTIDPGYK